MRKAVMLTSCITAAAVALALWVSVPRQQGKTSSSPNSMSNNFTANVSSSQETSSARQTQASAAVTYVVKAYKGHIGVFRNNETVPFREEETDVDVLPKNDRDSLEKGRAASTMAEVEKMVEDYDG